MLRYEITSFQNLYLLVSLFLLLFSLFVYFQLQDQVRSFREELQKKDALIQQLVR